MRPALAALGWLAASATGLGQTPATTDHNAAQAWVAQLSQSHGPSSSVPSFFDRLRLTDVDAALRAIRTPPLPARDRGRVLATLPASGALRPRPDERTKLESLRAVLAYHQRDAVFAVKLVDLPEASIGLRRDRSSRRRIELQCDGVAVLTLMALGQDPMRLTTAVRKLPRFNEGLGVLILDNYPTLKERERVVKTLLQAANEVSALGTARNRDLLRVPGVRARHR